MTDIPEAPSAMARAEQEVIRVLRDHLTATPPPVVDEDDLRLAAASIVEEVLAAAGKLLAEDDCRRVMQEEFDAQKAVVLAEVATRTDERLEQTARLVRLAERERLFAAIRHTIPLSQPWRGEALDLIYEVWRETDG